MFSQSFAILRRHAPLKWSDKWSNRKVRQIKPHRADQLKLWTDYRLNDRLNGVEGRTQCTLEVVPLGQKPR